MPRFEDEAVVLRAVEWSESSQIVTLLTRTHGKVRGLAKGSKRQSPSSVQRFTGGFELLTVGQVTATTRPSTELATVTEWDLLDAHPHLRRSLARQRVGFVAASYVDALTADEDPHEALYDAVRAVLGGGGDDDSDAVAGSAGLLAFQWALLSEVGYRPELAADVRTGAELALTEAGRYTFDPQAGGFTAERGDDRWRVRGETLALLRGVAGGESIDAGAAGVTVGRANRLLTSYVRELIGRELPTMGLVLG
ncbi:MAG: DNA repair protein RecO [Planctomycetota bacterium]